MSRTLAAILVRLVGVVVPSAYRDRFVNEWRAEILCEDDARRALKRSLGVFQDAMSTRRLFSHQA